MPDPVTTVDLPRPQSAAVDLPRPQSACEGSILRSSASLLLGGAQPLDLPVKKTLKQFHLSVWPDDEDWVLSKLPRPETAAVFRMKDSRLLETGTDNTELIRRKAADKDLLSLVMGGKSRVVARPPTPRALIPSIEVKDLKGRSRVKFSALVEELSKSPASRSCGDLCPGKGTKQAYFSFSHGLEWHMPKRKPYKQIGPLRPWEEDVKLHADMNTCLQRDTSEQKEEEEEENDEEDNDEKQSSL